MLSLSYTLNINGEVNLSLNLNFKLHKRLILSLSVDKTLLPSLYLTLNISPCLSLKIGSDWSLKLSLYFWQANLSLDHNVISSIGFSQLIHI